MRNSISIELHLDAGGQDFATLPTEDIPADITESELVELTVELVRMAYQAVKKNMAHHGVGEWADDVIS